MHCASVAPPVTCILQKWSISSIKTKFKVLENYFKNFYDTVWSFLLYAFKKIQIYHWNECESILPT